MPTFFRSTIVLSLTPTQRPEEVQNRFTAQGWSFYAEYADTAHTLPLGTCVAVHETDLPRPTVQGFVVEGLGSLRARPNSPVATTSINLMYLADFCEPVTEAEALARHPALFSWLRQGEEV